MCTLFEALLLIIHLKQIILRLHACVATILYSLIFLYLMYQTVMYVQLIQLLSRFRNHDSISLILIGYAAYIFQFFILTAERDDMEDSPASALVTLCPVNIDLCISLAFNYY